MKKQLSCNSSPQGTRCCEIGVWQTWQAVAASSSRCVLCNEGQVAATDWTDRQSSDRIMLRARTTGREKRGIGGLRFRSPYGRQHASCCRIWWKRDVKRNFHWSGAASSPLAGPENETRGGFYWQSVIHSFASLAGTASPLFKVRQLYILLDFLRCFSSQGP